MSSLRSSFARLLLAGALCLPTAALLIPTDASASVSIAVAFESLVKDADAVVVSTPVDSRSVWEDGRIYTYTKVKVDQGVAGDLGAGAEGWVRTMGGVVGKVGQLVDGEPVLTKDKPSLLFLRKFKDGGVYEVSARAQGQYPVLVDAATKTRKIIRSNAVGLLLPPRPDVEAAPAASGATQTQTQSLRLDAQKLRLAQEVIHDRPLADAAREIAATWTRLHAAAK